MTGVALERSAMQISSSLPSSPQTRGSSASGIVNEAYRLAEIIGNGSTASREEKLEAYESFRKLASGKPWEDPASYYRASTQQDRDTINGLVQGSTVVKEMMAAADRFNSKLMAAGRARTDRPYDVYDAYMALSEWEQKLVRVGLGHTSDTTSVEGVKAKLKATGDRFAAIEAAEQARSRATDKVSLSKDARAALGAPAGGSDAGLALETLTAAPARTHAAIALEALEKAAEARRAGAEEAAKVERRQSPGLYRSGDTLKVDA